MDNEIFCLTWRKKLENTEISLVKDLLIFLQRLELML